MKWFCRKIFSIWCNRIRNWRCFVCDREERKQWFFNIPEEYRVSAK